MILIDCTDTLRLVYDRGKDGYGVPVPGVRFKGTSKLQDALTAIRHDLEQMEWWQYIESVLTAGLYVDKPGAHGDGNAWDFDGVVLKPNPLCDFGSAPLTLVYSSDWYKGRTFDYEPRIYTLSDRIRTRLACLFSLRFPIVLTAGYNAAHEDHMHLSIAGEVGWRGSRSQVVCLQETLSAWGGTQLKVDGVFGDKTWRAWRNALPGKLDIGHEDKYWLDWLKMIAFDPPKDVK